MIKFVIGPKGSGKTGRLVDELNHLAAVDSVNIVCIERGRRLDRHLKPQIRLIDVSEYPIASFVDLLGFIAGISAKDFDLSDLYIDSIDKVSQSQDPEELLTFIHKLEPFAAEHQFDVTILLSMTEEDLPKSLHQYIV